MKRLLILGVAMLGAPSAMAQRMVVDSRTGNYVPYQDPNDPAPNTSPNSNSVTQRVNTRSASSAPKRGNMVLAQGQAPGASGSVPPSVPAPVPMPSQTFDPTNFVSMGDMTTYAPDTTSQTPDPFAKPDWWPH